MQQKCCIAAEAGGAIRGALGLGGRSGGGLGCRAARVGLAGVVGVNASIPKKEADGWWRIRREVGPGYLPRPARPCHQTNTPLFTPPSDGNVVFPVKIAVWTNPTRGARPLWQRVAVRGRRWQNLLPLGVFEGCEVGSSLDLPRPAPPCQHSVRHLLRHQKSELFRRKQANRIRTTTGNWLDGSAQREGRAGFVFRSSARTAAATSS